MTKFIGRLEELKKLLDLSKKKSASFIVLRGRRRIGKSRLIEEFSKYFDKFYTIVRLIVLKEENFTDFLNDIWDKTQGDTLTKTHAVLKQYFTPVIKQNFSLVISQKDRDIDCFMKKKTRDGQPLNTIEKLLSTALHISSGPSLELYLQVIHVRLGYGRIFQATNPINEQIQSEVNEELQKLSLQKHPNIASLKI